MKRPMTMLQIETALDKAIQDWDLKLEVAKECGWSAMLRITPITKSSGVDISTVFYVVCPDPLSGAREVYAAFLDWSMRELQNDTYTR